MMKQSEKRSLQHVFVIGAKSLGAYGGYETFVQKLTEYHQEHPRLRYHVACKANGDGHMDESKLSGVERISDSEFRYQNARCFKIKLPSSCSMRNQLCQSLKLWQSVATQIRF